jgi:hypothetical protein
MLTACATMGGSRSNFPGDDRLRPASDLPTAFEVDSPTPSAMAGSAVTCRSPLRDPRNGQRLVMIRSANGRADYQIPSGAYGSRGKELLRVDCRLLTGLGLIG